MAVLAAIGKSTAVNLLNETTEEYMFCMLVICESDITVADMTDTLAISAVGEGLHDTKKKAC